MEIKRKFLRRYEYSGINSQVHRNEAQDDRYSVNHHLIETNNYTIAKSYPLRCKKLIPTLQETNPGIAMN